MAPKKCSKKPSLVMKRHKKTLRFPKTNPKRFLSIHGSTQNDEEKRAIIQKFLADFVESRTSNTPVSSSEVAEFLRNKLAERALGAATDSMSNLQV
jgi:hypothetical protein